MKIQTKYFGETEIDESNIIHFKQGIPGFEEYKNYAILDIEGKNDLKCFQSVDDSEICLLTVIPWECFKDYEIQLSDQEMNELELNKPEDVAVYNVVTVRKDQITANLVAPIVINVLNGMGKQIILSNTKYQIRQEIPCLY
jgi:flagellar assembly factor FliW